MMAFYRKGIETAMGRFVIEANEAGISRLIFPQNVVQFPDTPSTSVDVEEALQQLKNYFSGEFYDFTNLRYDFSSVTDFQKKNFTDTAHFSKKKL